MSADADPMLAEGPWGDFLRARRRLILRLWGEGQSPEEIAAAVSLDAFDVIKIYQWKREP